MKKVIKKYFATIDTVDPVIWGTGRCRSASLKNARKWVKEYNKSQFVKDEILHPKTYECDKISYDRANQGEVHDFKIIDGKLAMNSVLGERIIKEANNKVANILVNNIPTLKEFSELDLHHKLDAIFALLKTK